MALNLEIVGLFSEVALNYTYLGSIPLWSEAFSIVGRYS